MEFAKSNTTTTNNKKNDDDNNNTTTSNDNNTDSATDDDTSKAAIVSEKEQQKQQRNMEFLSALGGNKSKFWSNDDTSNATAIESTKVVAAKQTEDGVQTKEQAVLDTNTVITEDSGDDNDSDVSTNVDSEDQEDDLTKEMLQNIHKPATGTASYMDFLQSIRTFKGDLDSVVEENGDEEKVEDVKEEGKDGNDQESDDDSCSDESLSLSSAGEDSDDDSDNNSDKEDHFTNKHEQKQQ